MNPELSLVDSDSHLLILHHLPISEEHINTDLRSAACGFNSYYKYCTAVYKLILHIHVYLSVCIKWILVNIF